MSAPPPGLSWFQFLCMSAFMVGLFIGSVTIVIAHVRQGVWGYLEPPTPEQEEEARRAGWQIEHAPEFRVHRWIIRASACLCLTAGAGLWFDTSQPRTPPSKPPVGTEGVPMR